MSEQDDEEVKPTATATTGAGGRNVIAVIGINRYDHWPALANAVRDATGAAELFGWLGFNEITKPLLDDRATGNAIQSLVTDDLRALGPDDSLVLFYAGHGGTWKHRLGDQVIKTGYLIPVDASRSLDKVATWLRLDAWLHAVSILPAKHILVVLDACHSGIALDPIIKWRDIGSRQDAPLAALQARRSRRIITSALDDQVALDSGPVRGHSLFTGCLLEGLTGGIRGDRGAVTTGSELGLYVQRRVQTYPGARQTPDFGTFAFDDRGEMAIPLAIERVLQRPEEPAAGMRSSAWWDLIDLDDSSQLASGTESQSSTVASGTGAEADQSVPGEPGPTQSGTSADGAEPALQAEARPRTHPFDDTATELDELPQFASATESQSSTMASGTGAEADQSVPREPGPTQPGTSADGVEPASQAEARARAHPFDDTATELDELPQFASATESQSGTMASDTGAEADRPVPPTEIAKPLAPASSVRRKIFVGIMSVGVTLAVALIAHVILRPGASPTDVPVHLEASNPTDAAPGSTLDGPPNAQQLSAGAVAGDCPAGMVRVPAGTFWMGSPDGVGDADEHPQHEVTLSAYCIDRTEVTVKAYAACVAARGCSAAPLTVQLSGYSAEDVKRYSRFCNHEDRPDHPINCVDWNQAAAYCTWAGKRLPTEAEWEYAARGTDGRLYPWGNEAPSATRLNACGSECVAMARRELNQGWKKMYDASDGWGATAPVGSFPDGASPFGAVDMAGNVWEWTADWYGTYPRAAATNPRGAETGTARVFRGGAWSSDGAGHVRAAFRHWDGASGRFNLVGFRCARGD